MYRALQARVHQIVEKSDHHDIASTLFDVFIIALVVVNIVAVFLESDADIFQKYEQHFYFLEIFSVSVFTAELVARLWSITADEKYNHSLKGRLRYARSPMLIIDFLAVLPYFIPLFVTVDVKFERALRFLRLLRILKLLRYAPSPATIKKLFRGAK